MNRRNLKAVRRSAAVLVDRKTRDATNIANGLANRGHGRDTRPGRHHRAVGQHHDRRAIARLFAAREAS